MPPSNPERDKKQPSFSTWLKKLLGRSGMRESMREAKEPARYVPIPAIGNYPARQMHVNEHPGLPTYESLIPVDVEGFTLIHINTPIAQAPNNHTYVYFDALSDPYDKDPTNPDKTFSGYVIEESVADSGEHKYRVYSKQWQQIERSKLVITFPHAVYSFSGPTIGGQVHYDAYCEDQKQTHPSYTQEMDESLLWANRAADICSAIDEVRFRSKS